MKKISIALAIAMSLSMVHCKGSSDDNDDLLLGLLVLNSQGSGFGNRIVGSPENVRAAIGVFSAVSAATPDTPASVTASSKSLSKNTQTVNQQVTSPIDVRCNSGTGFITPNYRMTGTTTLTETFLQFDLRGVGSLTGAFDLCEKSNVIDYATWVTEKTLERTSITLDGNTSTTDYDVKIKLTGRPNQATGITNITSTASGSQKLTSTDLTINGGSPLNIDLTIRGNDSYSIDVDQSSRLVKATGFISAQISGTINGERVVVSYNIPAEQLFRFNEELVGQQR